MLNKQKNNGITLIALIVTIITLLLLAGISIQMLTGENSIINRAGKAKELNELENAKEIANLGYMKYSLEKKISNTQKTAEEFVTEALNESGYIVTTVPIDGTIVTGAILKDGENSITKVNLKHTDSAKSFTVKLDTIEHENSNKYYVLINGKYQEVLVTDDGATISEEAFRYIPNEEQNNNISLTVTGLEGLVKLNNETSAINGTIEVKDGDIIKIYPGLDPKSGNISLSVIGVESITSIDVSIKLNITNGLTVNNYNKGKYSNNNNNIVWKIFYIGKMEESDANEEEHVYLTSEYTPGRWSIDSSLSSYKGTSDFTNETTDINGIKKKDYFPAVQRGLLPTIYKNGTVLHTRANNLKNIQATEYLLDSIGVWNEKYLDDGENENGYGLYAIGAPTIELLSKSFQQAGKNAILYEWDSTYNRGYKISNYNIKNSIPSGFWRTTTRLACPSNENNNYMINVLINASNNQLYTGDVNPSLAYRPIVCLKSNYKVVSDPAHSGQYKIVEK
ncbi:MAG TPA: hypothetical protein DEP51_04245 [Clostridiales bacterium]|nr:hypothetical protein [Clostridiales bacterium]